jgi:poly(A) polymerase
MLMDTEITALIGHVAQLVPEGTAAYIVGGTVRDILMGRSPADLDLAVGCGTGAFARSCADTLGGSAFAMDEARGVYRVALRHGAVSHLDVSPLAGTVKDDLAARDFTINAMALDMAGGNGGGIEIIDPFGGQDDISAGVIRVLGRQAFVSDPLRLLRAFRLSGELGFHVEEATLAYITELAPLIDKVSCERVRDELYLILGGKGSADVFRGMEDAGLLGRIIPETVPMAGLVQGGPHEFGLLEHSLRAMEHAEAVMDDTVRYFGSDAKSIDEYLDTNADGAFGMRGLVKLCALLHDAGKPATMKLVEGRPRFFGHADAGAKMLENIGARLRMSERAVRTLSLVASLHMRPLGLSQETPTKRAVHRLVRDAGDALPALLIVALADALATREGQFEQATDVEGMVRRAAGYYFGEHAEARANPLITGRDLIGEFGLEPGPLIGRILRDVEEKRAEGALNSREGALGYVREAFL